VKKIAFYVEGMTEQLFINQLLKEIAGQKNIAIELQRFQGAGKEHKTEIYSKGNLQPVNPKHYALILNCAGDGSVKSRILDDYSRLFSQGYIEVIGLLDLYPKPNADLQKFTSSLLNGVVRNGKTLVPALPSNTSIIVAVREIESWFLAECKHFQCIDAQLTSVFIKSQLGFDPCIDDMTVRLHPAQDLHDIYQLVNKSYLTDKGMKRKSMVKPTINCLEYSDIYLTLGNKINALKDLVQKIDDFLT